jgi:hypothetical protein
MLSITLPASVLPESRWPFVFFESKSAARHFISPEVDNGALGGPLPHEEGSAAAGLPDAAGQHRTIAQRRHTRANDTG